MHVHVSASPSSIWRPSRLSTAAFWSGERSFALCIIDVALLTLRSP